MKALARSRSRAFEASEDIGRNAASNPTIGDVIAARFHRRELLKGALGVAAISATMGPLALAAASEAKAVGAAGFEFNEIEAGIDATYHVADGYEAQVLLRWGDPVLAGAPVFDPMQQSASAQKLQFGYNNDYLGYLPIPGSTSPSQHGLLVVNHEYTNEELMFPGIGAQEAKNNFGKMTAELVAIEKAATGAALWRSSGKAPAGASLRILTMHAALTPTPKWKSRARPRATRVCKPTRIRRVNALRHVQ